MESCARCGATDPLCMYGLMSHWFAAPAGLTLDGGYFYLCPRCFNETIAPGLEELLDKLREHLPSPAPPPPPTTRGAGPMRSGVAPPARSAARPSEASEAAPAPAPTEPPETDGRREKKTGPAPEPGAAAGSPPA